MSNLVITPAPISIENLKKYFVSKDITYIIDYEKSQLKGKKLLTYLSNLDIPSDIKIDEETEEFHSLVAEYMQSHFLIESKALENFVMKVLLQSKGLIEEDQNTKKFIDNNKEIIEKWHQIIHSLFIYNMYIINDDEFKNYSKSFPEDDTLEGINFANLFKYSDFYNLFFDIDQNKFKFYSRFFEQYIFKGKSLFDIWANNNNPLFLITWGITEEVITSSDFVNVIKNDIKFLEDNKILF